MANSLDLKLVLKHLSNGTLGENLCINCLKPLQDQYENVFTKVCKYDSEYCFADVLQIISEVTLPKTENYNVCINCFMMASMAYKFYLLSKRSHEILNFYVNELLCNIDQIQLPEETKNNTLCISLPEILTETPIYDFNLHAIGNKTAIDTKKEGNIKNVTKPALMKVKIEKDVVQKPANVNKVVDDDNVVVIIQDNGKPLFYRAQADGILELLKKNEAEKYMKAFTASITVVPKENPPKQRRKRGPMSQKSCSRCSVKYRFIARLQEHMMQEHNVVLYVCKVCKATTEDKQEYHSHLKTHTNIHQCALCNTIFKKRDTIIKHLKWHEKMKNIVKMESAHICEVCGVILEDEESLRQHYDSKHYKKFTCYYCGRMYKGELSFNMHIKKHEAREEARNKSAHICEVCGVILEDEESLRQHYDSKHYKKFTCYYCGRMYKGELSFNMHIKKHEAREEARNKRHNPDMSEERVSPVDEQKAAKKPKCMCSTCGRYFVDERALMWHQRLHNNERPYTCDVCGRGFVSQNRRNQHARCAHTAPARRCPLCPALFHLRSMVNTHIKKVHLKTHKRRNRISKHQNVFWRTETVPIQELSVDIQNEILELQAAHENDMTSAQPAPLPPMEMEDI